MSKRCFPPVVNPKTRVLILGSLPGEVSLAENQYYAHRQNQFWQLISHVLQTDLVALAYDARLQTLLQHQIGLWDVIAEAKREGSLDSCIREHKSNDLLALIASLPELKAIAFNGKTAEKVGRKALGHNATNYNIIKLPSSSPAYTLPLKEKLLIWEQLSTKVLIPAKAGIQKAG